MSVVAVVTTRSAAEAASLRAAAVTAMGQSAYRAARARAVLAALDWLEGRTQLAPASGELAAPDAETVVRERLIAEDVEDEARRRRGDSMYPGVVAHTLSWWTRRADTEAPL